MVENIKKQFVEELKKLDWMDDVTKKHALEKIKSMEAYIAYPEELKDEAIVDHFYKNVPKKLI